MTERVGRVLYVLGWLLPPVLLVRLWRGWHERIYARALEAARADAEAERARFLRRLDHEIKNPLMGIRAGLANLGGTHNPVSREQIRTSIETQVMYLGKLVSDLRKIANIETLPAERERVDLGTLLSEVLALARDEPEAAARTLVLEPPDSALATMGDVDLLLHAVYNLVQNALKFTRPGDTITLSTFAGNGWVVIEVADSGPGIHPDDLPHVCEELYRGRDAQDVPGSGIGLALVRAIAGRHGGDVMIESTPGAGTAARLYLLEADGT